MGMLWLLLLMVMIMPFEMSPYLYLSPSFLGVIPDFTVIKLLGMVGFAWALLKVLARESGPIFESPQARLFVGFLIGIVISASLNESAFTAIVKYTVFAFFMPIVLISVRTHQDLRRIMYALGLTMVIVLPYAIRQTMRYAGPVGVGLYEPNYLASNLLLLIPIPLAISSYQDTLWKRLWWLAASGLLVMGLFMTSSRGGFLGLLIATLVYVYRRRGFRAALAVFVLLILAVLPTDLGRRAGATLDPDAPRPPGLEESNQAHTALFWGGLKMMHDAPLFGVGPQRFKDYSRRYSGLKIPYIAHNTYLELASEGGLPVLLVFLLMFLSAIVVLGRAARLQGGADARELAAWAEALRSGLIGFGVAGFFISAQFEKLFWVVMFLSIVVGRQAQLHAEASAEEPVAAPARATPSRSPDPAY